MDLTSAIDAEHFVTRRTFEQFPSLDDALAEIRKQTHWNDAMRDAAIKYVKAALGE